MAYNFSDEMADFAKKNAYGDLYCINNNINLARRLINKILVLKLKSKTYLVNLFRKIARIKKEKKIIDQNIKIIINLEKNSELIKNEIESKGYCYIENFLNNEFYEKLNDNYPSHKYFMKPISPFKFYNFGFKYVNEKNDKRKPFFIEEFPYHKKFYDYIKSLEFEDKLNNIFRLKEKKFGKLRCANVISSLADHGDFLIPHVDDIAEDSKFSINFIYFVDGLDNNVEYSGATSIYKDNNFKELLLMPKSLKNTCLIYIGTSEDIYHGFKLMKKNTFRKALTFHFQTGKLMD